MRLLKFKVAFKTTRKSFLSNINYYSSTGKNSKVFSSAEEAIYDLKSGSTFLVGGFGLCGIPEKLIEAIRSKKDTIKDLVVVSNDAGTDDFGLGLLLKSKQIKRILASYVGENHEFQRQYLSGELELEFVPQGSLAERIRAGGAGIPAFYTPTGFGTQVHNGGIPVKFSKTSPKQVEITSKPHEFRNFDGNNFILEKSIFGDVALVKAQKADKFGNLVFSKSAINFNPVVAKAAKLTIVEVEELVEVGDLDPDHIHLPGIYVDRIIVGKDYEKRIEKLTLLEDEASPEQLNSSDHAKRQKIVQRAAREFHDGMYVNLGIGIPVLAANYVDPTHLVHLQSENGILGLGPFPRSGEQDPEVINAGKETVTVEKGASFFDSAEAFAMIRGSHLQLTVLGAMQVAANGDLASWLVPGKVVKGMGGAMDLVSAINAKVVVTMLHTTKDGKPKILPTCTFPLTGHRCVNRIITDMAVFDVDTQNDNGLTLIELANNVTLEQVRHATAADFKVVDDLKHTY